MIIQNIARNWIARTSGIYASLAIHVTYVKSAGGLAMIASAPFVSIAVIASTQNSIMNVNVFIFEAIFDFPSSSQRYDTPICEKEYLDTLKITQDH